MKRTPEQVIWDFVRGWMMKAAEDYRVAGHFLNLKARDYFVPAFHSQQAAEKYLKAFLVWKQIPFPKTHVIDDLLRLVATADAALAANLKPAGMLSPYGVEFRYPSQEVATKREARAAYRMAGLVKAGVEQRMSGYISRGRPSAKG